jgi:uncharacterized RDD family membrane protein YckC
MNAQTKAETTRKKASFWRRLIALTFDTLIVGIPCAVITVVLELGDASSSVFVSSVFYLYNILLDYFNHGTVGKIMTNIRVIGADGRKPELLNAISRNFGKAISGFPLWWGFTIILAPHIRQTIHDRLSGCYVVEK